VRAVFS